MSIKAEPINHEAKVRELLEEHTTILTGIAYVRCESQEENLNCLNKDMERK